MTPEQLKASILQYAIQGKLVPQDPSEGTGEELYQQIQEEKRAYKIKEISITEMDEPPFDIPDTWKWIQLQDVVKKTIKRGKSPKYIPQSTIQVFAQKCNVKTGGINMELALFLDPAVIEKYPTDEYMCNGDIVINSTGGGTMGRVGIFYDTDRIDDMVVVPDGHVTVVRACDNIDYKYLYYFIKQNQKYLEMQGAGSTNQTELKPVTIASLMLPLPPLAEQHRIVAKIEELLPYVDRYAAAYEKLEQFNASFPKDMKKSVLQYAIQGKLVPQDPSEGTGEELYQQIQEEKQRLIKEGKLKKGKPLAEIAEDEIPFDIPESWKWVRWGDLSESIQYGYNAAAQESGRIKMVRISDIQDNTVIWGSVPYCNISEADIDTYLLKENDILFARTGGTVGKSFLVERVPEHAIYAGYLIRTRYSSRLVPKYMKYFMESQLYWNQLRNGTIATAQPNCNGKTLSKMILPLPPLAEQHRIVAKLEEILPLCDRLK